VNASTATATTAIAKPPQEIAPAAFGER